MEKGVSAVTVETLVVGPLRTNCYLVYDEVSREAFVVDPGDEASHILDAVAKNNLRVQAVVLTHVHFDHILACEAVCRDLNAPLYVGAGDEAALIDDDRNLMRYFAPHSHLSLAADRLLYEGDVLTLGEQSLTVMETPGHTPGSICLLGEEVLIAGDTLFCGGVGRTDFPGGDTATLRRSLARLMAIEGDRRVYPGHDMPATLARERATNPYVI